MSADFHYQTEIHEIKLFTIFNSTFEYLSNTKINYFLIVLLFSYLISNRTWCKIYKADHDS